MIIRERKEEDKMIVGKKKWNRLIKAFNTISWIYRARITELFSIVNEIEERIKELEMKQNEGSRKE